MTLGLPVHPLKANTTIMFKMFIVFVLVAFSLTETSARDCWSTREGQFVAVLEHALTGHSFLIYTEVPQFMCSVSCLRHSGCLSFNHNDTNDICQLNNATRGEFPASFIQDDGFSYYGKLDGIENKLCTESNTVSWISICKKTK